MAGIKIEISGADRIRQIGAKVQAALKASASLAPVRADAARITADSNRRSFANESSAAGQRWPALSPAYAKRKRRIVGAKPILQFSGQLKATLENPKTRIENFGASLVVSYAGSHSELIALHNLGTRTLPARPVGLALDKIAVEEINKISFERIRTAFSKALKELK